MLSGDLDTEVAVIGGGVTGITLAFTLAEQGTAVAVVEAGPIAGEATGRNAGFLTIAPAEPYSESIALWGRAGARAVMEIRRRAHRRVRELIEALHIDCDYRSNGSLRLARTADEADDLRAAAVLLKQDGFPMVEVPVAEMVPATVASIFPAAFFTPEDGEIHPVRFVHAVARAASDRGARIHADSPVEHASWSGGQWRVVTASGSVRARTLVIAANAYAPRLCPALTAVLRPRRGQMLATAPIAEDLYPRPTLAHWGYQYWRQTPDRRLVIGGWRDLDLDGEVGYEARPTEPIQNALDRAVEELIPGGAVIERRWAGIMGFARDGRPLAGWLDAAHHLAICAGYTGHGMSMAPACALDLAELLSWKEAGGISTFTPNRFPELREAAAGIETLGAEAGR
jgi:glycine/D-amino acid oxidase-like deaminating enzyme